MMSNPSNMDFSSFEHLAAMKAMVLLALADDAFTSEERAVIDEFVKAAGFEESARLELDEMIGAPPSISAVLAGVTRSHARRAILCQLLEVAWADDNYSVEERALIRKAASEMELEDSWVEQLEDWMAEGRDWLARGHQLLGPKKST